LIKDSSVVKVWVDNNNLRDALQSKKVPITRDYTVPVEGGFEARVRLYLPSDFDENKKYPLLIDV
jgi:dipeptidyl aminopeptidase/acylaminoacyl peptidase